MRESQAEFSREAGRDTNQDPWLADFPFPASLGLTACVGQVQQWVGYAHGLDMMPGWEENFARACAKSCAGFTRREDFELITARYRSAFETWRGGAFRRHFEPVYKPAGEMGFTGLSGGLLYVSDCIGGATSPAGFYHVVNGLLERPSELKAELHGLTAVARAA